PSRVWSWSGRADRGVDGSHGAGALSDCCRDALHRAGPDVAGGEDGGTAALERERAAAQKVQASAKLVGLELSIGLQEPLAVRGEHREPGGLRLCADEAEERLAGASLLAVVEGDGTQDLVTGHRGHLGAQPYLDAWVGEDAVDEVGRHAAADYGSAQRQGHLRLGRMGTRGSSRCAG